MAPVGRADFGRVKLWSLCECCIAGKVRRVRGRRRERSAADRETRKNAKEAMSSTTKKPSSLGRFWALPWKMKLLSLLIVPIALFYLSPCRRASLTIRLASAPACSQRLSTKGVACWTMEGELAQPSFSKSGASRSKDAPIDNTFYFSGARFGCPQADRECSARRRRVAEIRTKTVRARLAPAVSLPAPDTV